MKVLHVIDALGVGGGAEHSMATMLPLLRDRGVESEVVTLLARDGGLQAALREDGFDVSVLDARSWPGRVRALRRRILESRPDLVHSTLFNSCMVSRFACVRVDTPLLNSLVNTSYDPVRISDLQVPAWKFRVVRTLDAIAARHLVDAFHAITEAVAIEATDVLGVREDRVTVIPRGRSSTALGLRTAERRSRTRRLLGVGDDTPLVLNVGRQDHQKAQALLVRSFAEAHRAVPDAVLLVAGRPGDASREVDEAIESTGIGASVRLLGHRTDVADLLAACDVFVFPSQYEGLGCSLIEAMALEAPIIGSDAAAIAEVLEQGQLGVVVPRDEQGPLAAAMVDLLADESRRASLASRGRATFLERYEIERVADATVELYRRVIDG